MPRRSRALVPAAVAFVIATLGALAQTDFGFMPDGGRGELLALLGDAPSRDAIRDVLLTRRTEDEWAVWLADQDPDLGEGARRTAAAYYALNLPLGAEPVPGELATVLPPDGRDIAWNGCQYCHSLFSGYLTQDRDEQGWRSTFESPFHRELRLSTVERETFARYSALNMPLPLEVVPDDLRF